MSLTVSPYIWTASPSPSRPLCVYFLPSRVHSHCLFPPHSATLWPPDWSADLATSTAPKPTRARRFLLPFVFCSDSPPNGTRGSHWPPSAEGRILRLVVWQQFMTQLWRFFGLHFASKNNNNSGKKINKSGDFTSLPASGVKTCIK